MSRRRFLVTYDISDDKRRTRVFKLLEGEGDHVQYSVFLCDLNDAELIQLRANLEPLIHHREDQVLILDLGPATRLPESFLLSVGRAYSPPVRAMIV